MHGLLANVGGGIPNHDDSDDETADMPALSDTSSDAGDEGIEIVLTKTPKIRMTTQA